MIHGAMRQVLAGAFALLLAGCATISGEQRDEAAGIARAARSTEVDCTRADACALASPLRALGARPWPNRRAAVPRHYAVILDGGTGRPARAHPPDPQRTHAASTCRPTSSTRTTPAQLVLDELQAAAFRGVRVRVLIDQLSALQEVDTPGRAAPAMHANF